VLNVHILFVFYTLSVVTDLSVRSNKIGTLMPNTQLLIFN